MKKYSKPMLDIIEFDNLDVIVMSPGGNDENPADFSVLVEDQSINSDANASAEHEESVEPTPEGGNPIAEETPVPEEPSVPEETPVPEEPSVPEEPPVPEETPVSEEPSVLE